jgi:hypothetical protein
VVAVEVGLDLGVVEGDAGAPSALHQIFERTITSPGVQPVKGEIHRCGRPATS